MTKTQGQAAAGAAAARAGALTTPVLAGLLGICPPAGAAGGHHAVDDASILDPGQCQLETWFEREAADGRRLLHLGPGCRVGPMELDMNFDHARLGDTGSGGGNTALGAQLKWATALSAQWSVGAEIAASWQRRPHRYLGSSLVLPLTWQIAERWTAYVNVGRDFGPQGASGAHSGASLQWAPMPAWSWVLERYRQGGIDYARLAGRWNLSPNASLDLSRAKGLGDRPAWWTVGVNVAFTP